MSKFAHGAFLGQAGGVMKQANPRMAKSAPRQKLLATSSRTPDHLRDYSMTRKEVERTAQFVAKSADGREYLIEEFTEVNVFQSSKGIKRVPGNKFLQTQDGTNVIRIDKGHYQIMASDEFEVLSTDPNAV